MNCKPGDLAVRVAAPEGVPIGIGSIVTVLELCDRPSRGLVSGRSFDAGQVWFVEWNGSTISHSGRPLGIPDCELRPIRDNDGEDETMQWAPVPSRELVSSK